MKSRYESRAKFRVQLRELEGQLSEARQSGLALDAAREDLEAQLAAARKERDAAAARESSALAAAADAEARLAEQAADAQRQVSAADDRLAFTAMCRQAEHDEAPTSRLLQNVCADSCRDVLRLLPGLEPASAVRPQLRSGKCCLVHRAPSAPSLPVPSSDFAFDI